MFVQDPHRDRWRRGSPLPRPVHAFGAAAFGGELRVVGGRRGASVLREVWILDPRAGRWRLGPAPGVPRHALEAFVLGGSLYAVGGCTTTLHDSQVAERIGVGL